jgi:nicotinamide-nucleotide amidase
VRTFHLKSVPSRSFGRLFSALALKSYTAAGVTGEGSLEAEAVKRLSAAGARLATVESCTGGLIANRITNIPGSSAVFWGAWVTYDNSAKTALGVSADLIRAHGAVSAEVATAMAEAGFAAMTKALSVAGPAFCLATTGIAGPGGATDRKPVGVSFIALASNQLEPAVIEVHAPEGRDREGNKAWFADEALRLLLARLAKR